MAGDGLTIGGVDSGEYGLKPPLVSVVIVNWDYGRFVGAAIDSIRRQDYPHFECLIVDNGSTDDSRAVIARHVAGDPRFSTLFFDRNHGQMAAWLEALDRAKGEFVTVLDSDDIKFPNFISSHVQVHLALRLGIAFTSSRVVEIDAEDRVINGANLGFGFIPFDDAPHGLKPRDSVPRLATISDADYELLSQATARIMPERAGWFWAPTSANMYRREVMTLARPERNPQVDFLVGDIHFCVLCHIFGGSAVIDRTLSAYRVHARHGDKARPAFVSMLHMRTEPEAQAAAARRSRYCTLRTLMQRAGSLRWIIKDRYWQAVDQQSGETTEKTLAAYYAEPEVQQVFADYFVELIRDFDEQTVLHEFALRLPRLEARLAILRRLLSQAPGLRPSVEDAEYWRWVEWCMPTRPDELGHLTHPRVADLFADNLATLVKAFGSVRMLTELRRRFDRETRHAIIKRSRCTPLLTVAAVQNAVAFWHRVRPRWSSGAKA